MLTTCATQSFKTATRGCWSHVRSHLVVAIFNFQDLITCSTWGVVWNHPELKSSGVVRSLSESSRVGWSHPESAADGVIGSHLESAEVGLYRKCTRKVKDKKHNERTSLITSTLNHTAPVDSDQFLCRTTPDDSEPLRTTPDDSDFGRLRATLNDTDSGRI